MPTTLPSERRSPPTQAAPRVSLMYVPEYLGALSRRALLLRRQWPVSQLTDGGTSGRLVWWPTATGVWPPTPRTGRCDVAGNGHRGAAACTAAPDARDSRGRDEGVGAMYGFNVPARFKTSKGSEYDVTAGGVQRFKKKEGLDLGL